MIEDSSQNRVIVIEGGGMSLKEVEEHLKDIYQELITVAEKSGKVSLLINALNKEFGEIQARIYWSKGIRDLPEGLPIHIVVGR